MESFWKIGRKCYRIEVKRELHRLIVFWIRANLHRAKMHRIDEFFQASSLRRAIADSYPYVYEQPTRAFFYNKSSFDERIKLIEDHFSYLENKLDSDVLRGLYSNRAVNLWEQEHEGKDLRLMLHFHPGQRKEGLLALNLTLDGAGALYQMMFWIERDPHGEWALWIGAMQGPNMADSRGIIKKLTKACHGCRTKNLILHMTQEVARGLGMQHIYAVTNYGYYAMNHVRSNRKLKTNFGDFWRESGGKPCVDKRFYELPLREYHRTMEEVPTRKRAVYRRRYALLDEIDAAIAQSLQKIMK